MSKTTDLERLARRWHRLSDHAEDGTPFGAGLCNCMKQAQRVELLMAEDRLAEATATYALEIERNSRELRQLRAAAELLSKRLTPHQRRSA